MAAQYSATPQTACYTPPGSRRATAVEKDNHDDGGGIVTSIASFKIKRLLEAASAA